MKPIEAESALDYVRIINENDARVKALIKVLSIVQPNDAIGSYEAQVLKAIITEIDSETQKILDELANIPVNVEEDDF